MAFAVRYAPLPNHLWLSVAVAAPFLLFAAPLALAVLLWGRHWVLSALAAGLTVATVVVQVPLYVAASSRRGFSRRPCDDHQHAVRPRGCGSDHRHRQRPGRRADGSGTHAGSGSPTAGSGNRAELSASCPGAWPGGCRGRPVQPVSDHDLCSHRRPAAVHGQYPAQNRGRDDRPDRGIGAPCLAVAPRDRRLAPRPRLSPKHSGRPSRRGRTTAPSSSAATSTRRSTCVRSAACWTVATAMPPSKQGRDGSSPTQAAGESHHSWDSTTC